MSTNVAVATLEFTIGTCEADVDASIELELDDVRNCGKSCFKTGDTVHVKEYTYPPTLSTTHYCTVGNVSAAGTDSETLTEYIIIENFEGSVSKNITSISELGWFGLAAPDAGNLINDPPFSNRITAFPDSDDGCGIEEDEVGLPGIAKVVYTAVYNKIKVSITSSFSVTDDEEAAGLLVSYAEY